MLGPGQRSRIYRERGRTRRVTGSHKASICPAFRAGGFRTSTGDEVSVLMHNDAVARGLSEAPSMGNLGG